MAFPFSIRFVSFCFWFWFWLLYEDKARKAIEISCSPYSRFHFLNPQLNHMREISLIFSLFAYFMSKWEGGKISMKRN